MKENNKNFKGLSQKEAENILKKEGFNELPSQKKQSALGILLKILSEPMLLLLVVATIIYLFMGEMKDALLLVFSVFVVVAITFYQERKTEKTLEALKKLASPRALVIRDDEQKKIAGRDVVRGDTIIIYEGDRVPADSYILFCENFSVDESLLTGESVPVRKIEWDGKIEKQKPGGNNLPFIYSGTMAISGYAVAKVISVGQNTEMGKIGKTLESIKPEDTLLRKETSKIVRIMAVVGIIACGLVVVFYALFKNNIMSGLLAGLTLSMSMLPEEFPIVLLIFMTLGAWRISKKRVLTRNPAAIETLGAATVLCTDKTGTLTMNKMELSVLYSEGSFYELNNFSVTNLSQKFENILEYGFLASKEYLFDPIEKELNKKGNLYVKDLKHKYANFELLKEYPFSKKILAMSHAWQKKGAKEIIIASKGAPEAILELCHASDKKKEEVMQKVQEMSQSGMRVLGVAGSSFLGEVLPSDQSDFSFNFLGLVGFIDPVRELVSDAVEKVYSAGMRIIMITGDYPGTAQYVAKKIGINKPEQYLTGDDLDKMNHLELKEKIKNINIFARIVPEQKLLIINALKANNEIVAMTGDGVNDAPALKSSHIGIAMGERGTDVAREASALVLINDDFPSIVDAVQLGRRIYNNLKRSMGYLLAIHIPIAGMSLLPLFFGLPIVLFPAHIAFLELIVDPACSTIFESEKGDKNIMKRPPRNIRQPMFDFNTVVISALQGLGVLLASFAVFIFAVNIGKNEMEIRSFAFSSLIMGNLMLIAINLSWSKNIFRIFLSANKIFFIVFAYALLCLFMILYTPFFSDLFHMSPISIKDFIFITVIVLISLFWFEIFKLLRKN